MFLCARRRKSSVYQIPIWPQIPPGQKSLFCLWRIGVEYSFDFSFEINFIDESLTIITTPYLFVQIFSWTIRTVRPLFSGTPRNLFPHFHIVWPRRCARIVKKIQITADDMYSQIGKVVNLFWPKRASVILVFSYSFPPQRICGKIFIFPFFFSAESTYKTRWAFNRRENQSRRRFIAYRSRPSNPDRKRINQIGARAARLRSYIIGLYAFFYLLYIIM